MHKIDKNGIILAGTGERSPKVFLENFKTLQSVVLNSQLYSISSVYASDILADLFINRH